MRPFLRAIGLAGLVSLLSTTATFAQGKAERVKVTTVDGVDLIGHYYSGKAQGPVAILLHAFESSSRGKDWVALAESLQSAGYNVMTFDFRGHGDSTEVSDPALFWNNPTNMRSIKNPSPKRTSIEAKDFKSEYHPALINDIAAVKAFLDRRNDNKQCNTGSTIVIGAEEGATLGAIWLNSEYYRFRKTFNPMVGFVQSKDPEGKDVCAFLALSISPKVGTTSAMLDKTLYLSGRYSFTPMVFMHGADDVAGKKTAQSLEKYLKDPKEPKEKYKFTGAFEIKGTKLTGEKLLRVSGTNKLITDWLEEAALSKGHEWYNREFDKSQYYWISPSGAMPARLMPAEKNMKFHTYFQFIGR